MGLAEALGASGGGIGCWRGGRKPNRPDSGGLRDRFSGFPLWALVVARVQCGGCGDYYRCGDAGFELGSWPIVRIEVNQRSGV